jgi:Rrf2 family nitric oxide-sensitive transcriptional repressor
MGFLRIQDKKIFLSSFEKILTSAMMNVKTNSKILGKPMFSKTVEYALRAVVYLAQDPSTPRTAEEIAGKTKVKQAYLSKVLQSLCNKGLVRSQRGLGGGFTLAKDPDHLNLLEVVNAVDPINRIKSCPLELSAHGTHLCPLHRRVDNALKMVEDAFRKTTLAEILAEPSKSVPLCEFPCVEKK